MKKTVTILLMISSLTVFSQVGNPFQRSQQYPDFDVFAPNKSMSIENILFEEQRRIRQQNEQLIRQADYEYRQRQQQQHIQAYERQLIARHQHEMWTIARDLLMDGFRSFADVDPVGTQYFYDAFAEIDSMLKGEKELSIARSVFLVENAFYGNTLNYSDYQSFIKRKVEFSNRIIKDSKQYPNDNLAKNMAIFRLLTDTVPFKNSRKEKTEYHLPLQYDYDDYQAKENFDSRFVTKLMASNIGQCFSMPLYYLILAGEMNADAYWSFSPKHSFVKIQDSKGKWYNLELTCGAILSDAHYMSNSYIKAEAILNKIYLEPLDKKQTIAFQLLNLAQTYCKKYGFDDFYLQCTNSVSQYIPNSVEAVKMQGSYYQKLLAQSAQLLGKQDLESFGNLQGLANGILAKLEGYYKKIDDSGYEETPDMIYEMWLKHIEEQKNTSDKNRTILLNEIK